MSLLADIQMGKSDKPPRILIYGNEGLGKSTLCAQAPKPVFIQTEDGLGEIDCAKFPLATTLKDVSDALNALCKEPHDYQTVVIDSADWLERLVFEEVCRDYGVKTIIRADGGYGKGYFHALTHWNRIIKLLDKLRNERNMLVLITAHAKVETFNDPENVPYDRYSPRLHTSATSLLTEWVDAVLFVNKRMRVSIDNNRAIASPIGADGGERIIRTCSGPACLAKNRYNLPGELPLNWDVLMNAILAERDASPEPEEGVL